MIVPVIPPQSPLQELIHGPVAAPPLVRTANPEIVYGICTLGESGCLLDRHNERARTERSAQHPPHAYQPACE